MKFVDRVLQGWRIRKVRPYVPAGSHVLDVGCAGNALYDAVPGIGQYVGIDPHLVASSERGGARFIKGWFPQDLPPLAPFDVITMLAVLEHLPPDVQPRVVQSCADLLRAGGRVVLTVPSPFVDHILTVLRFARLVDADAFAIDQHHGFDVRRTADLFGVSGFILVAWIRFELGLNNLFVFQKV